MNVSRAIPVPQLPDMPDLTDPRMRAVAVAKKAGDHQTVREQLFSILRDRPNSIVALNALSTSYAETEEWASCLQFAEASTRVRPDVPMMHRARAQALVSLGRPEEARAAAELAIRYSPRDEQAHGTLLTVLFAIGTDEARWAMIAAIAHARQTVALSPSARVRNSVLLGDTLAKLGLRRESRRVFADLFATQPEHTVARQAAASMEASGRRWSAAMRHLDVARALAPTDGNAVRQTIWMTRRWFGRLGVFAGTGLALAAVAEWALPDAAVAGAYAIVGLLGFVTATVLTCLASGREVLRPMRVAARDPQTIATIALTLVLAGGMVLGVFRPGVFDRMPGAFVGVLGCFVAVQVLVGGLTIGSIMVGERLRSRRYREAVEAAIVGPPEPPPQSCVYPIRMPTSGQLMLVGGPLERERDGRVVRGAAAAGVTMLVTTAPEVATNWFRLGGDPDPTVPALVDVVAFPILPGAAPSEPEFVLLISAIGDALLGGECVGIMCHTAAERSALVAAAVCVRFGLEPAAAWDRVEGARGAPLLVSASQRAWLDSWHAGARWRA